MYQFMGLTMIGPGEGFSAKLASEFLFVGVFAADVAFFLVFAEEAVAAVFADEFFGSVGVHWIY